MFCVSKKAFLSPFCLRLADSNWFDQNSSLIFQLFFFQEVVWKLETTIDFDYFCNCGSQKPLICRCFNGFCVCESLNVSKTHSRSSSRPLQIRFSGSTNDDRSHTHGRRIEKAKHYLMSDLLWWWATVTTSPTGMPPPTTRCRKNQVGLFSIHPSWFASWLCRP